MIVPGRQRFGLAGNRVVDSDGVIEVFALQDGKCALVGVDKSGETFTSPLPGQPVPLAGLFA